MTCVELLKVIINQRPHDRPQAFARQSKNFATLFILKTKGNGMGFMSIEAFPVTLNWSSLYLL
jgi:hypothetical protein